MKRFSLNISAPSLAALAAASALLLAACAGAESTTSNASESADTSTTTATTAATTAAKRSTTEAETAPARGASSGRCSDFSNQADAQRAANTRDADGDGVYCESLPCPCLKKGASKPTGTAAPSNPEAGCVKPSGVQQVGFSATKYPNIRRHFLDAVSEGWPATLVIDRRGTDARRDRLLPNFATRAGYDRDEYPPAMGRGRGSEGLTRGANPVGWKASVMLVPSSENRSHGSVMGIKLRRFCSGTRFSYRFY
ncbi:MAG: hypothetical protein JHD03_08375 [Solirubrobacteraceae bacterium]|nr:hypothetical protein [Solirubrobacteraceae bacterium]